MKICAYCGALLGSPEHQKTDEHIIPNSLLKLFPDQDISIHNDKVFVDNRGLTISDVCSQCNNGILANLDAYGKELIEGNFYEPYEFEDYFKVFQIKLNENLFFRWILKIIYNGVRLDSNSDPQFVKQYIPYIMQGEYENINVNFLLGLHINLNPVPEDFLDFIPLQINYSPEFLLNSYIRVKNGEIKKKLVIKEADKVVVLRLGNAIISAIFWKPQINEARKQSIIAEIEEKFRFRKLDNNVVRYSVRCVSSPTNTMAANYNHFYSEEAVSEILYVIKNSIGGRNIGKAKEEFVKSWTPMMNLQGKAFVEAAMFPNNTKKKKVLDDIINNRDL